MGGSPSINCEWSCSIHTHTLLHRALVRHVSPFSCYLASLSPAGVGGLHEELWETVSQWSGQIQVFKRAHQSGFPQGEDIYYSTSTAGLWLSCAVLGYYYFFIYITVRNLRKWNAAKHKLNDELCVFAERERSNVCVLYYVKRLMTEPTRLLLTTVKAVSNCVLLPI